MTPVITIGNLITPKVYGKEGNRIFYDKNSRTWRHVEGTQSAIANPILHTKNKVFQGQSDGSWKDITNTLNQEDINDLKSGNLTGWKYANNHQKSVDSSKLISKQNNWFMRAKSNTTAKESRIRQAQQLMKKNPNSLNPREKTLISAEKARQTENKSLGNTADFLGKLPLAMTATTLGIMSTPTLLNAARIYGPKFMKDYAIFEGLNNLADKSEFLQNHPVLKNALVFALSAKGAGITDTAIKKILTKGAAAKTASGEATKLAQKMHNYHLIYDKSAAPLNWLKVSQNPVKNVAANVGANIITSLPDAAVGAAATFLPAPLLIGMGVGSSYLLHNKVTPFLAEEAFKATGGSQDKGTKIALINLLGKSSNKSGDHHNTPYTGILVKNINDNPATNANVPVQGVTNSSITDFQYGAKNNIPYMYKLSTVFNGENNNSLIGKIAQTAARGAVGQKQTVFSAQTPEELSDILHRAVNDKGESLYDYLMRTNGSTLVHENVGDLVLGKFNDPSKVMVANNKGHLRLPASEKFIDQKTGQEIGIYIDGWGTGSANGGNILGDIGKSWLNNKSKDLPIQFTITRQNRTTKGSIRKSNQQTYHVDGLPDVGTPKQKVYVKPFFQRKDK